MSTTGHESEAINVSGLKASLKKGGNIGIYNEAICSTAGGTAAKVTNTTPPSFTLTAGAKILVKFTYAISAENATLQVGSTTAKPIYYKGAALPADLVKAGTSVLLQYDGTSFNIVGDLNTDTTYSTMGASGSTHSGGLVPDTPSTAGTTKFLREDGTWQEVSALPEVEIGETAPTEDVKLFVDEDADPAVSLDVYTRAQVDALTRHTRLTDFDLNVLKQAVADQNLEKYGLKVGDQKTINGHTYVIAGLNPMKGTSTPYRLTQNHVGLIVIPHTTQAWNVSGNTSTGADNRGAGYLNSDLHYYLKNTLLPLVNTDLGAANLLGHSKLLSNAVADGKSSNWTWEADCKICALSEVQVYGSRVWSSSPYDVGEACRQLEVFQRFSHTEIFGGEYPWLRDVVSASYAALADHHGHAGHDAASRAYYVAALILFN